MVAEPAPRHASGSVGAPDPLAPAIAWFTRRGWEPFAFQREVWRAYLDGECGLIHAATGSGKTHAAWFGPLLEWLAEGPRPGDRPATAPPLRVLWITPLRALAADTEAALRAPLVDLGLPWTLDRRTGDSSAGTRARQRDRLPTALVTTPESLTLLLTRADAAQLFSHLRAVVVDEWHELLGSKRGVQTELALARLRRWCPDLRVWALSATLGNLDEALDTLLGTHPAPARLVRGAVPRPLRIEALIPSRIDRFPWAGHLGLTMLPQVLAAIESGRSTLVFTNTRAQSEQWYAAILEACPGWEGTIALHHASLDRATREAAEEGLRSGTLRCVVCTSSLDLGVDFSPVDTVIQVGSPKGVARLLQRAGRSGHQPGAESRVLCAPTHAFELVEVAAVRAALAGGAIEPRPAVRRPLDVLVQHLVTVALGGGFSAAAVDGVPAGELYAEVRDARAYADLAPAEWGWALDFVARGGEVLRAYPEYARVAARDGRYTVADATVARRHRLSIGTIVDEASLRVQYLRGPLLGQIEEGFIARLRPGDRFVLGGKTLEFVRVREMTAWVRRARTPGGVIPRWSGGRLPLSDLLAGAMRTILDRARAGRYESPELAAVRPILELQSRWSAIPAAGELLIEQVATREGFHLFVYPFEGRLVHAGLAALLAYRLSQRQPATFTLAVNDYGFELLSSTPPRLEEALAAGVLRPGDLAVDIPASLNAAELARRQFREIARIAGLVFTGYPGNRKTARQVQASSGLLYDVFARYDPDNPLLEQARREVLERQLERERLGRALLRLSEARLVLRSPERPTPFAFPLLVERLRETVSSERLADRVARMGLALERAADGRRR